MLPKRYDKEINDPFRVALFGGEALLNGDYEIGFYCIHLCLKEVLGHQMLFACIRHRLEGVNVRQS